MNLIFLQNCISPHQMPYIKELPVYESVDRVVVVAPRIDYDDRKQMGWKTPELLKVEGIEFLITPTIEVVQKLYEECKGIETFCFFSGINAIILLSEG